MKKLGKIAFLVSQAMIEKCFSPQAIDRLRQLGDVLIPQGEAFTQDVPEVQQSTVMITGWGNSAHFDRESVSELPSLRLIAHSAGSVKKLISPDIWDERELVVTSSNPALAQGVAEFTLGIIICSLKNVWEMAGNVRKGEWRTDGSQSVGRVWDMHQVTIGVLGAGQVGRRVISLLKPFEVEILLYDPTLTAQEIEELGAQKADLDEVMRRSDLVSNHLPTLPETMGIVGACELSLLNNDSIFVNTGRGAAIDSDALLKELVSGRIRASLDVTDPEEPPAMDSPLRSLPNVLLTPHIAGHLTNGCLRQGDFIVNQIERFAAGESLEYEITREMLGSIA